MKNSLADLLEIKKGITSIIGGGGKTTLMLQLAKELAERSTVIITTSTKILQPEACRTLLNPTVEEVEAIFAKDNMLCIASKHESGKLAAPSLDFVELSKLADYVLVEADGSKHLPIKAHASFEPVVPAGSNQVIYVLGIEGIGQRLQDVCHRPELFAKLTGCSFNEPLTAEFIAQAIYKEISVKNDNFAYSIDRFFINKVNSAMDWQRAEALAAELAKALHKPVMAGSLWKGEYKCLF